VYVVSRPPRGTLSITTAVATYTGVGFEEVGSSLTLGDVDGNGTADLVVGAPGGESEAGTTGAAYVVPGPVSGEHAIHDFATLHGEAPIDGFGVSVASGFDRDGDGVDDLVVGAWGLDAMTDGEGAGYFFYGPPRAGPAREHAARFLGEGIGARAGMAVTACEGWDGTTVVIGAPGAVGAAGEVFLFP
jgi:hypothetical protein